jgi:transcriptional regulator with XRE-family HTH domain
MNRNFGEHIQFHRLAKHLNKSETARRVGITPQYVRDIEDNRTVPSEEVIEVLVGVLDMDERETFKMAGKIPSRILELAKKQFYEGD